MERYEEGRWGGVEDRVRLGKMEGQVWIMLYKLLMDQQCQQRYEFTSASKSTILQVR